MQSIAGETALRAQAPAALAESLSSIPAPHTERLRTAITPALGDWMPALAPALISYRYTEAHKHIAKKNNKNKTNLKKKKQKQNYCLVPNISNSNNFNDPDCKGSKILSPGTEQQNL